MTIERFRDGMRIRVVNPDDDHVELKGKTGTVVRLLMRDISAWVTMDEDLPENLRKFGSNDPRSRNVNIWPDECEQVRGDE